MTWDWLGNCSISISTWCMPPLCGGQRLVSLHPCPSLQKGKMQSLDLHSKSLQIIYTFIKHSSRVISNQLVLVRLWAINKEAEIKLHVMLALHWIFHLNYTITCSLIQYIIIIRMCVCACMRSYAKNYVIKWYWSTRRV